MNHLVEEDLRKQLARPLRGNGCTRNHGKVLVITITKPLAERNIVLTTPAHCHLLAVGQLLAAMEPRPELPLLGLIAVGKLHNIAVIGRDLDLLTELLVTTILHNALGELLTLLLLGLQGLDTCEVCFPRIAVINDSELRVHFRLLRLQLIARQAVQLFNQGGRFGESLLTRLGVLCSSHRIPSY